jgi:hypothetical protein
MTTIDQLESREPEHQLFIGRQAAADVMWDRLRPQFVAVEMATHNLPGFVRYAMMAGAMAAGLAHANLVVQEMRKRGLI